VVSGDTRLRTLQKKPGMPVAPWKRGASAPRKVSGINAGFQPLWLRIVVAACTGAVARAYIEAMWQTLSSGVQ